MGLGVYFVSLIGGYIFLRTFKLTRYSIKRDSGYHLLFKSATIGTVLVIILYPIIRYGVSDCHFFNTDLGKFINEITAFSSFVLGYILAAILNIFDYKYDFGKIAIMKYGNLKEILLYESAENNSIIEVTLNTGKVYIGWVSQVNDFIWGDDQYFKIITLLSGYRDEKLNLIVTTNYAKIYVEMKKIPNIKELMDDNQKDIFVINISSSSLITIRPFFDEIYSELHS